MKNAILLVNEFLSGNKFNEIYSFLKKSANNKNINLEILTNAQIPILYDGTNPVCPDILKQLNPEFILFWDKDIVCALFLEQLDFKLYNNAKSIEICDNKALTQLSLAKNGIKMPKTIIAPKTFDNIGYTNLVFLQNVEQSLGFPLIIKECYGSFGMQVYLVDNHDELVSKVKEICPKPMLFQEFIKTSFAKDIRVNVVGKKAITSMYRYSQTGDFRANISNGGKMKQHTLTKQQIYVAEQCCKILDLDYAGVDLLFGENDDDILVCEVNSNAHFKNIYDCTGVNLADYIIDLAAKETL